MGAICENRECRVCGETKPLGLFAIRMGYLSKKCRDCFNKEVIQKRLDKWNSAVESIECRICGETKTSDCFTKTGYGYQKCSGCLNKEYAQKRFNKNNGRPGFRPHKHTAPSDFVFIPKPSKARLECSHCGRDRIKVKDPKSRSGFKYRCTHCANDRRKKVRTVLYCGVKDTLNEKRRIKYELELKNSLEHKAKEKAKREIRAAKGIERARQERFQAKKREEKIVTMVGQICEVINRVCACGKKECVKAPKRETELTRCWACHVKHTRHTKMLGKTFVRVEKEVNCRRCGIVHVSKAANSMCGPCARKLHKERALEYRRAHGRGDRNRVKKHGVLVVPFRRKDVFERDNYQCRMCRCAVQKDSIYMPNAAELDHIIPISKGGAHALYNMQTLCRRCNAIKSDRVLRPCTYTIQRIVYHSINDSVACAMSGDRACVTQGGLSIFVKDHFYTVATSQHERFAFQNF